MLIYRFPESYGGGSLYRKGLWLHLTSLHSGLVLQVPWYHELLLGSLVRQLDRASRLERLGRRISYGQELVSIPYLKDTH